MRTLLMLILLALLNDSFSLVFTGQEKSLSNVRETKTFNKLDLGVAVDMHMIMLKTDDEAAEADTVYTIPTLYEALNEKEITDSVFTKYFHDMKMNNSGFRPIKFFLDTKETHNVKEFKWE